MNHWLRKLLNPPHEREERQVVLDKAQEAVDAANKTVDASTKARREVVDLQLKLRRRSH